MPFTLTMPKLSPTMESGTIAKWQKNHGDFVNIGDVLMEVATDKATVEYQAIDEGWLRQIIVPEGEEASVNVAIAVFTAEQQESIEGYQPTGVPKAKPAEEIQKAREEGSVATITQEALSKPPQGAVVWSQPAFTPEPPLENYSFQFPRERVEERLKASPLAKKLAKEKGLDLTTVKGSGPGERIVSRDLDSAQVSGLVTFGSREVPQKVPGSYEEIKLSPIRKIIAQRLQESKSFIPHFYVRQEVDAEALALAREQLKVGDIKVSINDLVVRASALALRKHPEINRGFNSVNQTILQFGSIDISVAVSLDSGLITPIIRHADYKNLGEIATEIRLLAQRGREGKLELHEYKGGSFTVSNLGMHGVSDFLAIINPPQAAILAVSAIHDAPVIKNGLVVPGKVMNISISIDHRVIDGVAAALFLKTVKGYLENPALLLI